MPKFLQAVSSESTIALSPIDLSKGLGKLLVVPRPCYLDLNCPNEVCIIGVLWEREKSKMEEGFTFLFRAFILEFQIGRSA